MLRAVAEHVGALRGEHDRLGRYGGEELMMVMPSADLAQAAQRAERVRAAIADLAVPHGGSRLRLTTSIGAARLKPGDRTHHSSHAPTRGSTAPNATDATAWSPNSSDQGRAAKAASSQSCIRR